MDGEAFRQQVIEHLCQIPYGKVMTYGSMASWMGYPGWARRVGYVLRGLDPEASHLPWHRVVGAQGKISTGPLMGTLQRTLLESEGVCFVGVRCDLKQHQWQPGC